MTTESEPNNHPQNNTSLTPTVRDHLAILALQAAGCQELGERLERLRKELGQRLEKAPQLASPANRELVVTITALAEQLGRLGRELNRLAHAREDFNEHIQRILGPLRLTDRLLALAALSETLAGECTPPPPD